MNEWVDIASKNGIALAALFALAVFIYKKLWPLIEKRLTDADVERKENLQRWESQGKLFTDALRQEREDNARRFEEQGRIFSETMRTQNVLTAESHKDSMRAQSKIVEEIRRVHEYLKNGNGK